jgi:hypothetical protein
VTETIKPGALLWDDSGYPHVVSRVTAKRVFVERATRDERAPLAYRGTKDDQLGEFAIDRAKLEQCGEVWVRGYNYPHGFVTVEDRSEIADYHHRPRIPDPTCSFCDQPKGGEECYKIGPPDADQWVDARCHSSFCQRNREEMEAQGFVNGVCVVYRR